MFRVALQDFIQRGPVPQSSGPPGLPGPAPGTVFACTPPVRHPDRCPGRPQQARSSPSPAFPVAGAPAGPIPVARGPAPACPAATSRSLKRLVEALLIPTTGPMDGSSGHRQEEVSPRATPSPAPKDAGRVSECRPGRHNNKEGQAGKAQALPVRISLHMGPLSSAPPAKFPGIPRIETGPPHE